MADEATPQPGISAREKAGLAFMAAGFSALVGGIACISLPWAAIIGGAPITITAVEDSEIVLVDSE